MYRVILIVILCLILAGSFTACWDAHEVDEWSYVYSIGIDKGVADKLRITVQIPTLKGQGSASGSSGQSGSQSKSGSDFTVETVDCSTLFEGVDLINSSISRKLNYSHAKFIVISEAFAREGVESIVNGIRRASQIRRITHFIVSKGEASEFIKEFNPILGAALSKTQEGLMSQQESSGLFNDTPFGTFINEMRSTEGQPSCVLAALNDFSGFLPQGAPLKEFKGSVDYVAGQIPRTGGNKFEFIGTALFNGDKMVGELNGDETRVMLMANGEYTRSNITVSDPLKPNFFATATISEVHKPKIKISFRQGKPVINVKLSLEGVLQNLQSNINYETKKLKPILENAFKSYIKDKLDKTIQKCQGFNCDAFGFGETASMHFWTIQEWQAYNWNKQFRNAEVITEVGFIMKETGTVIKTNPTSHG